MSVSSAFYDAVLEPLGASRLMDFGVTIGYGVPPEPDFWIGEFNSGDGFRESHIAFTAADRASSCLLRAAVTAGRRCCTNRACGPSTTPIITARRCATRMATMSRPSATSPSRPEPSERPSGRLFITRTTGHAFWAAIPFDTRNDQQPRTDLPGSSEPGGRVRARRGRRRSWVLGRSRRRARCGPPCPTRRPRPLPWRTGRAACRRRASRRSRCRSRCETPRR